MTAACGCATVEVNLLATTYPNPVTHGSNNATNSHLGLLYIYMQYNMLIFLGGIRFLARYVTLNIPYLCHLIKNATDNI